MESNLFARGEDFGQVWIWRRWWSRQNLMMGAIMVGIELLSYPLYLVWRRCGWCWWSGTGGDESDDVMRLRETHAMHLTYIRNKQIQQWNRKNVIITNLMMMMKMLCELFMAPTSSTTPLSRDSCPPWRQIPSKLKFTMRMRTSMIILMTLKGHKTKIYSVENSFALNQIRQYNWRILAP